MQCRLLPLATVITPNLAEAAALLGDAAPLHTLQGMEEAARQLQSKGAKCVLVKGGHLRSEPQDDQPAGMHSCQLSRACEEACGGHSC